MLSSRMAMDNTFDAPFHCSIITKLTIYVIHDFQVQYTIMNRR